MATPAHRPTEEGRKSVKAMSAYGIPQDDISVAMGLTGKTLRKHYRDELSGGQIRANAAVAGALYKMAIDGNVTAAIFWTKARMGWSDRGPLSHEGDSADEIAKAIHVALTQMEERNGSRAD